MNIGTLDLAVIVIYIIGITAAGMLSVRKQRLTGEVYFLAGRALRWPAIGAALFASNISTIHLVGLAEGGYQYGLVIGNFEWMATFTLILLALIFAPFYFTSHISTLPEFLEKRYSPAARTIMALMAILSALLIYIGISLYAGAVVFREFFGVNVVASIVFISVLTAIYTVVGVMLLAMAWSTQGGRFGSIFEAINKMPAQFLAPPITTVFVWGVFWRRGTKQAALATLLLGFTFGLVAFLVDLPAFGDTQWITDPQHGLGVSFMMQAWWGFCLCSAIYVVISLLTPPPDPERVARLTRTNPLQVICHGPLTGWPDPRVVSLGLLGVMLVLYSIFH